MSDMIVRTEADNYQPVMTVAQAIERRQMIADYTAAVMIDGEDYGIIPGTGTRKVLLKPGAEKLVRIFGLTPRFSDVTVTEDWTGESHGGESFFHYTVKCSLYRNEVFMGDADGSCNSWEKKYRYSSRQRKCPVCGAEAIITGKKEYGGGFICFDKKGGCKAKFGDNDTRITSQSVGQIADPDIADKVNTIRKMAEKRALVAACLIVVGASEFFTQDIEPERPAPQERPQAASARPAPPQRQEDTYDAEWRPADVDESGEVTSEPPPTINKKQASDLLKGVLSEAGWVPIDAAMYKEMLFIINPQIDPGAWTTNQFIAAANLPRNEIDNCIKAIRITTPKEPAAV